MGYWWRILHGRADTLRSGLPRRRHTACLPAPPGAAESLHTHARFCATIASVAPGGRGYTKALGGRPGLAADGTVLPTGTLIVLLMTALELWVAADSHVIAIGAQQGSAAARCKIHRVGAVFSAEAELLQDTSGRYHAAATPAQRAPRGAR
jgi:hypothetical protein